jgi:predicted ATP-grasp superfamily ATP-dependent carboligase
MLLQQYVCGVGEGLFGLAADDGVLGWSAHRRLRMMNPQGSGSSACTSRDVDDGLKASGERFIALSGWRGLFMIELLRDESGKVWFMELNGRAWGSMALARRLGFEYPAWAVKKIFNPGAQIVLPRSNPQPLVCRHLGRELVHLLFVMRGPKSRALARWPSRWSAVRQFLSFAREERWYNWRANDRKVFFSDAIGTVKGQIFKAKGSE